jgi:hypothetical protein
MHTHTLTKFQVVDFRTDKVMGVYTSRRTATHKADALDQVFGAYRFMVRPIAVSSVDAVSAAESMLAS